MHAAFLLRSTDVALQRTKAELLALDDWELAGTATHWREALERLPLLQPDVLVSDVRLGDTAVSRLLGALNARGLRFPTVVLVGNVDEPLLLEAIWHGALGYRAESGERVTLKSALQSLLDGCARLSPAQTRGLMDQIGLRRLPAVQAAARNVAQDPSPAGRWVSTAQLALLSLLAHGWLTREIAAAWQLEVLAVEQRVGQLLRMLQQQFLLQTA